MGAGALQYRNFAFTCGAGREVPVDETNPLEARLCLRSRTLKAILRSVSLPCAHLAVPPARARSLPSLCHHAFGKPLAHCFCLSTQAQEEGGWAPCPLGTAGRRAGPPGRRPWVQRGWPLALNVGGRARKAVECTSQARREVAKPCLERPPTEELCRPAVGRQVGRRPGGLNSAVVGFSSRV